MLFFSSRIFMRTCYRYPYQCGLGRIEKKIRSFLHSICGSGSMELAFFFFFKAVLIVSSVHPCSFFSVYVPDKTQKIQCNVLFKFLFPILNLVVISCSFLLFPLLLLGKLTLLFWKQMPLLDLEMWETCWWSCVNSFTLLLVTMLSLGHFPIYL